MGDNKGTKQRQIILDTLKVRHDFLRNSQDALYYMAAQTGGLAIQNTNDLGGARARDQRPSWLLLDWLRIQGGRACRLGTCARQHPREKTGSVDSFPSGSVRSRDAIDDDTPAIADPLVAAALSPFTSGAVPLRLNALFARSHQSGYLLQSQLYIEGHDVPLVEGADGRYQAELEIGELLVGDNGMLPAGARRKLSLTFDDEQYRQVRAGGMLYTLPFTLKESGRVSGARRCPRSPDGRGRLGITGDGRSQNRQRAVVHVGPCAGQLSRARTCNTL